MDKLEIAWWMIRREVFLLKDGACAKQTGMGERIGDVGVHMWFSMAAALDVHCIEGRNVKRG